MPPLKILFLNLGYARGIAGRLSEHVRYAHRHIYCSPLVQQQSLTHLNKLIEKEQPDLCCFVEIDQGATPNAKFSQIEFLKTAHYTFSDIENKYGKASLLRSLPMTAGKSNGFLANRNFKFEKLFFSRGIKRLIYRIELASDLTLFFAHFSLNKIIRTEQIVEARDLMRNCSGEVVFMGDFNILGGLQEIGPMLDKERFILLNQKDLPTFLFHRKERLLDLCISSPKVGQRSRLRVLQQSFTDHAALILEIA